jgi:hypothetical protein
MKTLLIALSIVTLTACVSVPVERKFPNGAQGTMEPCVQLNLIPDTDKLSVLVDTVATNYGIYQECAAKTNTWIEWYNTQKKIFESVK